MNIANALRFLRNIFDYDLKTLSKEIDISSSYLSEIENGKKQPSLEIIQKYADKFKLKMSDILLIAEKMESTKAFKFNVICAILSYIK